MGKIFEALHKASASHPPLESKKEENPLADISPGPAKQKPARLSKSRQPVSGESLEKRRQLVKPAAQWDERVQLAITPSSPVTESFRKLRTVILHPMQGKPPRTLLITSAVPSEGKGFVTANLGLSIAKTTETRCMMVDCDIRRPTLPSLFGLNPTAKGLVNYLRGETHWSEAILPTAQKGLTILPSGPPPDNPSELIDSNKMTDLIKEISGIKNELFLFDSPPLHAAAETAVLAKMVDKILIVVRWGTSGREQVTNLIDMVGREKIIGIVFNAFEQNVLDNMFEKKGYYGYYGYYGKGY